MFCFIVITFSSQSTHRHIATRTRKSWTSLLLSPHHGQTKYFAMSFTNLESLDLPATLSQRSLCRVLPAPDFFLNKNCNENHKFILYLPTVVLRHKHNPGFALACRLANNFQIPLLILCTVLDDKHLSAPPECPISMTARRLAFTLEALQSCCQKWENHGAAVVVRVHGPGARTPHHLTLAHQACAVVTDEAFVEPFCLYNHRIFSTCQAAKVPCWSVDGSTTVPPCSKLRLVKRDGLGLQFTGVPEKAWAWEKRTNPQRKSHVYGATRQGHLTAPELAVKLPQQFIRCSQENCDDHWNKVMPLKSWRKETPGSSNEKGVFTAEELSSIVDIKDWVMTCWPGADTSVPPCKQTHGSITAACQRWKNFSTRCGLKDYAKRRNQIVLPHAVSRISCYLNLGILSIFDVVHDVWHYTGQKGYSNGCHKFLEEVVKWREIGYCYTFANGGSYSSLVQAIPKWAYTYLEKHHKSSSSDGYSFEQLEQASTSDPTWNAMQDYLNETGELHNNARMTWGKTVVHWQKSRVPPNQVLWQLCHLNDRFALDGLSPPSYAGILWCFGWGDKPSTSEGSMNVSTKWASRYRTGIDGFAKAKENLYQDDLISSIGGTEVGETANCKKTRREDNISSHPVSGSHAHKKTKTKSIISFFSPISSK